MGGARENKTYPRGRPGPAVAPRWLPLSSARAYSGLGSNTLRRLADEGLISAGRTAGGHRRFDRESIDEYFGRDDLRAQEILGSFGR